MNLPNRLTVLRVLMIPLFLWLYFDVRIPGSYFWAFLTFALASLTDMLDGMIARKYDLVTDFGKLMDPLADKLLTISAFVCLLGKDSVFSLVMLIAIISREFIVTSMRLVAAEKGIVIAADKWGKFKTISQMVWICQALLNLSCVKMLPENLSAIWSQLGLILFVIMMTLTIGSGVNYVVKNRGLFRGR